MFLLYQLALCSALLVEGAKHCRRKGLPFQAPAVRPPQHTASSSTPKAASQEVPPAWHLANSSAVQGASPAVPSLSRVVTSSTLGACFWGRLFQVYSFLYALPQPQRQ